ncbi:15479_t:CDS:1 [Gigaspora rosea]|nr:15479_t:CDS:1 [Gigaspora rosea]
MTITKQTTDLHHMLKYPETTQNLETNNTDITNIIKHTLDKKDFIDADDQTPVKLHSPLGNMENLIITKIPEKEIDQLDNPNMDTKSNIIIEDETSATRCIYSSMVTNTNRHRSQPVRRRKTTSTLLLRIKSKP